MLDERLVLEAVAGAQEGHRILRVRGALTIHNLFDFQGAVREESSPLLIIDLARVPFVDSAGIGALVGASISREKAGLKVALTGVGERVLASLRVSKLERYFRIFPNAETAEQSPS
jgi:anti-anti-sigma factor